MVNLFVISLALSVDGFGIASAFAIQKRVVSSLSHISIAGCFAFFQFVMPLLGWMFGHILQGFFQNYTNWIAFFLLVFTGLRMILGQVNWSSFYAYALYVVKIVIFFIKKEDAKKKLISPSLFIFSETKGANLQKVSFSLLCTLGVITSVDSLIIGASYGVAEKEILFPACIISIVTFLVTFIGSYCSFLLSQNIFIAKFSTIIGGLIIIGIGFNELI